MRQRTAACLLTAAMAAMAMPAAASSGSPYGFFLDAGCYDGEGQAMDRTATFPNLGAMVQYIAEANRTLDPADTKNGICSQPLRLTAVWRVPTDGSGAPLLLVEFGD